MKIMSRVLAPAVVLGLLLSGCGGGSDAPGPASLGTTLSAAIVPPSIAAGFVNPASASSPVGTNLTQVVDYSTEYPFVNMMKQARPWFSGTFNDPDGEDDFDDGNPLELDDNGDVEWLETGQVARTVLFDVVDPDLPGRVFNVFYTGKGDLSFVGSVETLSSTVGQHRIRLLPSKDDATGKQTVIIILTSTDRTDPLREVRILPTGGICTGNPLQSVTDASKCSEGQFRSFRLHHDTIVFNPDFLSRIQTYRGLRFMDWMRTNRIPENTVQREWADRPVPADAFWSTGAGVPLEVMIALANLMGMDPWFNIPHAATDDYVTQFATRVRNQLDPARKATIEYSNEVWNGIFGQAAYVKTKGDNPELNFDGDKFLAGQRYYSRRSRQVMQLFDQVFGDTARLRLNRVMATQFVQPSITKVILDFENAAAHLDQFAVAPYFGSVINTEDQRNWIKRTGVKGVFDWILDGVTPTDDAGNPVFEEGVGSLKDTREMLVKQRDTVESFVGLTLTSYEGGQHFVHVDIRSDRDTAVDNILELVNGHARMRTAYMHYLANVRNVTRQPFYHYLNVGQWGVSGYWGALRYQTQAREDAPKYDALMSFIELNPR